MFCDLIELFLRIEFRTRGTLTIKASEWGLALKTASAPGFTPSFWGHKCRNQGDKKSLWRKSRFFRSDSISTIYPKSRFCTKRHKRRCFQGFSGFFKSFSRNVEKENCKFEHRKCSFVFDLCFSRTNPRPWLTPFLWLQRGRYWGMEPPIRPTADGCHWATKYVASTNINRNGRSEIIQIFRMKCIFTSVDFHLFYRYR